MLDEHAEHELYHLAVKGIIHKGQADIQIDLAILMNIVLKALTAGIQIVEIFLDPGLLVLRQVRMTVKILVSISMAIGRI